MFFISTKLSAGGFPRPCRFCVYIIMSLYVDPNNLYTGGIFSRETQGGTRRHLCLTGSYLNGFRITDAQSD